MHRIDSRRRRQWYRTGKRICETALLFEGGAVGAVAMAHLSNGPVDPVTVVGLLVVTPLIVWGTLLGDALTLSRSTE